MAPHQSAPEYYQQKMREALNAGRMEEAKSLIAKGLKEHPRYAPMHNSAGNVYMGMRDLANAAACFAKAATLAPNVGEFVINHAIALTGLNRHAEACAILRKIERTEKGSARYCTTRANAERGAKRLGEAAAWYDEALRLEPSRPKALYGRAWIALERFEPDLLSVIDRAIRANPGSADLWLARAQALEAAGDIAAAREIAQSLADQAPSWIDGLQLLAQIRYNQGEEDFTSHYEEALRLAPNDPNIAIAWISILGGAQRNDEAADVAARCAHQFPAFDEFRFMEGIFRGAIGDIGEATRIFAALETDRHDRWLHMSQHYMRLKEFERAEDYLKKAIALDRANITAWAQLGVVWRLTDNVRGEWLHGQEGLFALRPLVDADKVLGPARRLLHELHDHSPFPLSQSLRGGTQTRSVLFNRMEPELAALRASIMATLEEHRRHLPKKDATHPLLRFRDAPWALEGSWSVRLSVGDSHASHIHPEGLVSSALYCQLPSAMGGTDQAGALELGRPPADFNTGLGPISVLEPKEGYLALFPSTLYHGTRPFSGDEHRMTVAFDVTAP